MKQRRFLFWAVLTLGAAGAVLGAAWMQAQQSGGGSKPVASASRAAAPADGARAARPPSAEILIVQPRLLVDSVQAIGTVRARRSVMLRPEVPGRVVALPFKDGAPVRKGQPMVQLDDRVQRAELQQMQAQLTIAETNFRRTQELTDANFVSRQARDSAAANLDVAKAQLALSQARLERMTIRAPFDGVAGIRQVEVGDYVKDGSNLVAVEDPHDRVVDFTLPQRRAAQVRLGLPVEVRLHEAPGAPVLLGRIEAIEPQQDPTSRALSLRARLLPPAAAGSSAAPALRAGMAVGVTVEFGRNPKALMVPEESIVPQNGQQFVVRALPLAGADTACAGDCVAGAGGVRWRSQRQVVSLGTRLDGWVEVVEGLSATDRVVTAGQQRLLKDGTVFVELPSAERSHGTKAAARGASAVGANRAPATPTAASAAGRS